MSGKVEVISMFWWIDRGRHRILSSYSNMGGHLLHYFKRHRLHSPKQSLDDFDDEAITG
jgi:hypothetical protein